VLLELSKGPQPLLEQVAHRQESQGVPLGMARTGQEGQVGLEALSGSHRDTPSIRSAALPKPPAAWFAACIRWA
jgi:hypothetical protein